MPTQVATEGRLAADPNTRRTTKGTNVTTAQRHNWRYHYPAMAQNSQPQCGFTLLHSGSSTKNRQNTEKAI